MKLDTAVHSIKERDGESFGQLFNTVTSDNGSKFADLHKALQEVADVYFSHPYASWERGRAKISIN